MAHAIRSQGHSPLGIGVLHKAIALTTATVFLSLAAAAQTTDIGWPRVVQSNNEQIQIYQPQVDRWLSGKLEARAAIVVTERASGEGTYGVVSFSAHTTLDQDRRLVTLYDIEVSSTAFPSAGSREPFVAKKIRAALPRWQMTIALDRLLADMAITQTEQNAEGEALGSAPPKIFVRQNPAVLILIDGQPVMQKVEGTGLSRVINSPATIIQEPDSGRYFLLGESYWMTAASLEGPWSKVSNPPSFLDAVAKPEEGNVSTAGVGAPPEVIVSMESAELLQLRGQAQFAPIKNTKLLSVSNTDGDLFLSVPEQQYYVLLSGRWFRSPKLDGPWEFVRASSLPKDFERIPPDHAKSNVLVSVPGTTQAQDAVVAAQVPQTATVDRKNAQFAATYDGEPQFKPIEGTDMMYAVNSPNDIIFVGGRYYAVSDGVWFVSDSAQGPWVVADNVPTDVYRIPPTSPVYHVKYVYVYDSTPDFAYVGYLPGYFGAYVWDGVVVYGTGFWYPCWCGSFWFGWPWTWGFGWHYWYWGGGYFWRPWHPNRWYWHHWEHGPRALSTWDRRVLYNRSTERTLNRPIPGVRSVYDRWQSSSVVGRHPVPLRGPGTFGGRPRIPPQRPATARPDLYAGKNGQVYQRRSDGWYQRNGRTWERIQSPHSQIDQLNRAQQGRTQGSNRVQQYHAISPPHGGAPGGRPSTGGRPHR